MTNLHGFIETDITIAQKDGRLDFTVDVGVTRVGAGSIELPDRPTPEQVAEAIGDIVTRAVKIAPNPNFSIELRSATVLK
jgi:hypothetical protein